MTMPDLLPCPFCGKDDLVKVHGNSLQDWVECLRCNVTVHEHKGESAKEKWNACALRNGESAEARKYIPAGLETSVKNLMDQRLRTPNNQYPADIESVLSFAHHEVERITGRKLINKIYAASEDLQPKDSTDE